MTGPDACAGTMVGFISAVRSAYLDNPFHNFKHAVDVTHTVYR